MISDCRGDHGGGIVGRQDMREIIGTYDMGGHRR